MIRITEAPRDAMQGIKTFISTEEKVSYLHKLLEVGFTVLDCCSFVSKKVIPQMQDSASVIEEVTKRAAPLSSELLAIVVNLKGAEEALKHQSISYLGFPLSLSETFQQRNARQSLTEAFKMVQSIHILCKRARKKLRIFLSMGFGNPYGDTYNETILLNNLERLQREEVEDVCVADTVGSASPSLIERTFLLIERYFPKHRIGAHLHTAPQEARDKIAAAYQGGCKHFDATMRGYGGCPMAEDTLIGNVATEILVEYLKSQGESLSIDEQNFKKAQQYCATLFGKYTTSLS